MNKEIQPKYEAVTVTCNGCGTVIETRSTKESINVEVCSKCHPFYTGDTQNRASRAGRVDKFNKKYGFNQEEKAA